jgi:hypothetical protein
MSYSFQGDLCQMSKQERLLVNYGFKIKMLDVYPTVETEEEFIKAISLIWNMKCEGWWHYRDWYFKHNICTPYEYWVNLGSDRTVKLYHFVNRKDIWDNKVSVNGNPTTDVETILNRGDLIMVGDQKIVVS